VTKPYSPVSFADVKITGGFWRELPTELPHHLWANREPGSMQVWIAEATECG
jgi:hypothetical protein